MCEGYEDLVYGWINGKRLVSICKNLYFFWKLGKCKFKLWNTGVFY